MAITVNRTYLPICTRKACKRDVQRINTEAEHLNDNEQEPVWPNAITMESVVPNMVPRLYLF